MFYFYDLVVNLNVCVCVCMMSIFVGKFVCEKKDSIFISLVAIF